MIPLIASLTALLVGIAVPAHGAPVGTDLDRVAGTTQSCTNEAFGLTVRFPARWHTNTGNGVPGCALFDPAPIQFDLEARVVPAVAVLMRREPLPLEAALARVLGQREVRQEATTVGGRRAVRLETDRPGLLAGPRGVRFYLYLIDLGDATLIASTNEAGMISYRIKTRILDEMMASLRFTR
jgi:hypothetical protein